MTGIYTNITMLEEDDGMLLNFAAVAPSTEKKPLIKKKIVGGRWKDRRRTRLALENRLPKYKRDKLEDGSVNPNQVPVSGKRRRENIGRKAGANGENEDEVEASKDEEGNDKEGGLSSYKRPRVAKETRGSNGDKGDTFVSSLFTANPEVQKRDYNQEAETGLKPSNAPLINDESADFAKLGINKNLCRCLEQKLGYAKPTKIQRAVIPELITGDDDMFVQAQTGSGKTLAFSIPIIERLMRASDGSVNRKSGIFAIILSPTRELATQTYEFLANKLCSACHWVVPGLVIGGEKKKSEKARIRKGVNILVATPGRLADHIENTNKLDLSRVRYLVLDEGDRMMDLGFEEAIGKLLTCLESVFEPRLPQNLQSCLPAKRVNILCSATMEGTVKKLGQMSLNDAKLVTTGDGNNNGNKESTKNDMMAPEQLVQEILVVPPKLRFVTLSATLKNLTGGNPEGDEAEPKKSKTIVFFSCSDSVDFHFIALTRTGKRLTVQKKRRLPKESEQRSKNGQEKKPNGKKFDRRGDNNANRNGRGYRQDRKDGNNDDNDDEEAQLGRVTAMTAPLINENVVIYKLHGSLSQEARTATLNHFAKNNDYANSILFCTDVASRGLDLPNIKNVVEYDPPFTLQDHLHRVGRTARVGGSGLSTLFLLPGDEENYIKKIEPLHGEKKENLRYLNFEDELKRAFAQYETESDENKDKNEKRQRKRKARSKNVPKREGDWDIHATTFQLNMERWLLGNPRAKEIATNAFVSHTRAYTTHLSTERDCFNFKKLHLGHLAKSFGLRETPKKLASESSKSHSKGPREDAKSKMFRMARKAASAQSAEFNTI